VIGESESTDGSYHGASAPELVLAETPSPALVRRWHRPGVTVAEVGTPQTCLSLDSTAYAPVSALMKSCVKGFARTLSSFGTSSLRWGVVMWTSSAALSVHLAFRHPRRKALGKLLGDETGGEPALAPARMIHQARQERDVVEAAHGTNENDVRSTIVRRETDLLYGGDRRSLHRRVESAPDQSRGA
jgi:hypothetical protein